MSLVSEEVLYMAPIGALAAGYQRQIGSCEVDRSAVMCVYTDNLGNGGGKDRAMCVPAGRTSTSALGLRTDSTIGLSLA